MSEAHTIAVGDVHMKWDALLKILGHFQPQVCFVAGDFGWWPSFWDAGRMALGRLMEERPRGTEIRFIDGNHEDHAMLAKDVAAAREANGIVDPFAAVPMREGLWYQPRGSLYELADGRRMLCCGGGKSVDAPSRTEGFDWFPEEILRREEMPKTLPAADVVLSHTVPNRLGVFETLRPVSEVCSWWDPEPDPTCAVLDEVFDACRPSLWIASHLHVCRRGKAGNTDYVVLDRTDGLSERPWEDFVEVLVP